MLTSARKEREKEQRRSIIIDAAQDLFFSNVYDKITIEAIAQKAQLAKGTVYLYFKNKESLYSAVALRGTRILNSLFKEMVSPDLNGLDKAFATGKAYCEFYRRCPQYFKICLEAEKNLLVLNSGDADLDELMKLSSENLKIVMDAVSEGVKDGSIKPDADPLLTSIFLIQSTRSMIQLPPGFEIILRQESKDKDGTLEFTLKALRDSLQNANCGEKRSGIEK